uniref:palmitoyltransferase ZDHHC1-like n=1 Tax=Myxine glutinosa TaxID=7769 RepID=UPI0035902C35
MGRKRSEEKEKEGDVNLGSLEVLEENSERGNRKGSDIKELKEKVAFGTKEEMECPSETSGNEVEQTMQCCIGHCENRTVPEEGEQDCDNDSAQSTRHSRINGWSWPLHPFQILAWLVFFYFVVIAFAIFVPLLPYQWKPAGYICISLAMCYHAVVHIATISVDPADLNVRIKKSYRNPIPAFDRSKHKHVIENLHCHLCSVDVGPKSKHCSNCNKCIASFDHHCKWLNNCVGQRNYWLFINTVTSALLTLFFLLAVLLYIFIQYFREPHILRTDSHFSRVNDSDTWLVFLPIAAVHTTGPSLVAIAGGTTLLSLLCTTMLLHLLCFHIFLRFCACGPATAVGKHMSTYEYVVWQRQKLEAMETGTGGNRQTDAQQQPVSVESGYEEHVYNAYPEIHPTPAGEIEKAGVVGQVNKWWVLQMQDEKPQMDPGRREKRSKSRFKNNIGDDDGFTHNEIAYDYRKITQKHHYNNTGLPYDQMEARPLPSIRLADGMSAPQPLGAMKYPWSFVQAVGPPAEYNSDSAESMNEIPVVNTRMGGKDHNYDTRVTFAHHVSHQPTKPTGNVGRFYNGKQSIHYCRSEMWPRSELRHSASNETNLNGQLDQRGYFERSDHGMCVKMELHTVPETNSNASMGPVLGLSQQNLISYTDKAQGTELSHVNKPHRTKHKGPSSVTRQSLEMAKK